MELHDNGVRRAMSFARRRRLPIRTVPPAVLSAVNGGTVRAEGEQAVRKIVVSEFISLDGVIQAPGGAEEDTEGGFSHGGWTWPYWHDEIGAHFFEAMSQSDALLLGRKTWQIHGGAFEPMLAGDPFGDLMNNARKYVVSNTLSDTSAWRNSTLISGNAVEGVRALKEQPGKNILIDGSSVLIHTLAESDLIDEYSLWVYPLVLGGGKKLFPEERRIDLKLVEARPLPSGVVLMHYERA
jgi:dihydrofolate reductase